MVAFSALPPQAQQGHRERLAVRVMAILNAFWTDERTPDVVRTVEIEGWLDVLQVLSEAELRQAWANYQATGIRTERGALRRPDPGILCDMAMRARAAAGAAPPRQIAPPEPERPMPTYNEKLEALRLCERLGFTPRRMEVLAKAPMATSMKEAERITGTSHTSSLTANQVAALSISDTDEAVRRFRAAGAAGAAG